MAKDLFGRPLRVVLCAWILSRGDDPFYVAEAQAAAREAGEAESSVIKELQAFERYGMLTKFQDARRHYYTPVDSPLWRAYFHVAAAVGLLNAANAPGESINGSPEVASETDGR